MKLPFNDIVEAFICVRTYVILYLQAGLSVVSENITTEVTYRMFTKALTTLKEYTV